jgi:regulator of sigma E protease
MATPFIFIVILGLLILSHELGHFLAAKWAKMRVDEFAFGFPPKLFSFRRGETVYSLNLIPFGGFVKIHGEDSLVDDVAESVRDRSRRFTARPKKNQAVVIGAGVVFNLILAWLLLTISFGIGFPTQATEENKNNLTEIRLLVASVLPESPAERAGLKIGDTVTEITVSGITYPPSIDATELGEIVQTSKGARVTLLYERGNTLVPTEITPVFNKETNLYTIGIGLESIGLLKLSPAKAIQEGGMRTVEYTWLTLSGFFNLIRDALLGKADLASISGPVGIYFLVSDAAILGLSYLLGFTAIISISLAVINILPFPALDGGRLAMLIVEALRGKPLSDRLVARINTVGFMVLIFLMVLVSYRDLAKYNLFG